MGFGGWCLQVENAGEGAGGVSGESDTVFRRNKVRSGFKFVIGRTSLQLCLCVILLFPSFFRLSGSVGFGSSSLRLMCLWLE